MVPQGQVQGCLEDECKGASKASEVVPQRQVQGQVYVNRVRITMTGC